MVLFLLGGSQRLRIVKCKSGEFAPSPHLVLTGTHAGSQEANGMLRVAAEISCRECALKTELQQDIKSPLSTHCKSQP